MSNLYRGPSIDASYQVSVHLAQGFGKSSYCLWQGELKMLMHIMVHEPIIGSIINSTSNLVSHLCPDN
jgi:hypothetical protein